VIPFSKFIQEKRVRDYKAEYKNYQGKPAQLKYQSDCHKARRKLGLGNSGENPGIEVDHKNPRSKGGSNEISNLRAVSFKTNRKKSNK
jgi:5-methylcytosine-specific restriction endonuclease McrA